MLQPVAGLEFFTLDVFTTERFRGNPLAVVNEADCLSDEQMQTIAAEFNLSETVFVLKPEGPDNTAAVRIFTPSKELPFAGHPTIGTAILLTELGADFSRNLKKTIRLEEKIGLVSVEVQKKEGGPAYAQLSAVKMPRKILEVPDNSLVAAALNIKPDDIGFGLHKVTMYEAGNSPLFVPVASRQLLADVRPDLAAWGSLGWDGLGEAGNFGIYVYYRGKNGCDEFHTRFFGLEVGIIEDPATGSAVVPFAGALNEALMLEDGEHSWAVHQGEDMGRASRLDLNVKIKDSAVIEIKVGGNAVRVSRGVISV